jgi:hypothetical protein
MLLANRYEIPDTCPEKCPFKKQLEQFSMCSMCFRCPILNCSGGDNAPLDPSMYEPKWAKDWYEFFKGDMNPGFWD